MNLSPLHIAVDLTPLLKEGANGGVKQYIFEVIPWLQQHFGEQIRFLFLTSSISHDDVRTQLASPHDAIICINKNSKQHALMFHGRGNRDFLWNDAPEDLLWRSGVNMLYCPFGATFNHCPGIPTLATVVDLLHLDYPQSLNEVECLHRTKYFTHMASTADAFQCISDYGVKRLSESYSIKPEQIFRTHLIIADRLVKLRSVMEKSSPPFFFFPANFWPHKNHLTLLVAYANYVSRMGKDAWNLVLTGFESPEARTILNKIETLGILDHVRYEGHVSECRLNEIWASASALVFPSLHEGFGIPLVEAMAYGLPIICGTTTCLKEVAGDSALFVDAANPYSLADALVMITSDDKIRERLSEKSIQRFNCFSFDREMEKLANCIKKLAGSGRPRSTIKGIAEDGTLEREIIFSHSKTGRVAIYAAFQNCGVTVRIRLRCGDRRFGSWELPGNQEMSIEAHIFCDGAPCLFEYELDKKDMENGARIVCKKLEISNIDGSNKEELFLL